MAGANKVALITGSTSGIGLACAHALAKRGVHVIITGFGEQTVIDGIINDIKGKHGVRADYFPADLNKVADIETLWTEVLRLYPDGVDILINNAGFQHLALVEEYPDDMWDMVIAVNVGATFHLTKRCLPAMKKKGWGRIVNTSSVRGFISLPNTAPYTAAKHAVIGLTKGVALENASHGITCNAVCPSYVMTGPIKDRLESVALEKGITVQQAQDLMMTEIPIKKPIEPEQVAELIEFLCLSNASSQMTGAAYMIDNGQIAQ